MGWLLLLLAGFGTAAAQEVTWPGMDGSGFVVRGGHGEWFSVDPVEVRGNREIRVRKLSADLREVIWTRVVGGDGADEARAVAVDAAGSLLVLGNTGSADLPVTEGVVAPVPVAGAVTAFLMKIGGEGGLLFSTYLHEGSATRAEGLLRVREGEIVVALSGRLWHLDLGARRVMEETVSPWIGGAMALDERGGLYVGGTTQSDTLPVGPGALQRTRQSGTCSSFVGPIACATGYVMRLGERMGTVEAATYLGGTAPAGVTALAVDGDVGVVVTGDVRGGSVEGHFPTTAGAFLPVVAGRGFAPWFVSRENFQSTPFVARLTRELDRMVYGTYLAGTRAERARWIGVDGEGRAMVGGDTVSRDFPGTGAFARPCGPDPGPNGPSAGFVARLSGDGTRLDAGVVLPAVSMGVPFAGGDGELAIPSSMGVARVWLDWGERPVVACAVNGGSYRTESYVAPGQLVTLMGAGFPEGARLLFDGEAAEILYASAGQINAVVPERVRGRERTEMRLEADGAGFARRVLRVLEVRETNPTIKVFVRADGKLEDRGNPLADVRLEDGRQNGTEHPARRGEVVDVYATGLDLRLPVEVNLPDHGTARAEVVAVEEGGGGVQRLRVRIPGSVNGGVVTMAIVNGGRRSAANGGFVWVE